MPGSVTTIADTDFETEVLNVSDTPVLIYFWASWCGPCRLVSPSIDWAASQYGDRLKVLKMEVDPNPSTVAQCKVEGVPALRLFNQGELEGAWEGAITRQKLQVILEEKLSSLAEG